MVWTTVQWFAALAVAAVLAACGGGSAPNAAAPAPGGGTAALAAVIDRIEPLDTAAMATPRAKARALVLRGMSPGQARHALGRIALPPLDVPAAQARSAAAIPGVRAGSHAPVQIGVPRALAATADADLFAARLQWVDGAAGTRVAAVSFASPGAQGVRLGVTVRQLPAQAVLRFYAQNGGGIEAATEMTAADIAALAARNLLAGLPEDEARTLWSPDFGGDETTLEIELPATAALADVRLAVPRLSHFVVSPQALTDVNLSTVGAAQRCEVDVTCRSDYEAESRAVVRMIFVSQGSTYFCSGTLLNDTQSSGAAHVLSARHCMTSQAEASTLVTDWFFQASNCGELGVNTGTRRLAGGAALLHTGVGTDVSLVRLLDKPPAGALYAGSYFGAPPAQGAAIAGLHHPEGDLQKISLGRITSYNQCADFDCKSSSVDAATFYGVQWDQGATEDGSSGSALFLPLGGKRYVVGQLSGGASSCRLRSAEDVYGRFDSAYRNALHQWLNPS